MTKSQRAFWALVVVGAGSTILAMPASARAVHARGANGTAGAFCRSGQSGKSCGAGGWRYGQGAAGAAAGSWAGSKGGSLRAAGGGFATRNAGLLGGAFSGTGPRGGSGQGAGAAGWKRGVGGFAQSASSFKGAGGSYYNGATSGMYNAASGQGFYNASRDAYNVKTGNSHGYDNSTTYQKGEGAQSSLDTQNHGSYTIDWNQGAKPVVQQTP